MSLSFRMIIDTKKFFVGKLYWDFVRGGAISNYHYFYLLFDFSRISNNVFYDHYKVFQLVLNQSLRKAIHFSYEGGCRSNLRIIIIQRLRQRSPPLFPNLSDAGCEWSRNSWSFCYPEKIFFLVVWLLDYGLINRYRLYKQNFVLVQFLV